MNNEVVAGQAKEYAYAYDPAGQLRRVEEDGVLVAEYTYDANGNRLAYETPGGTTTYEYDARGNLRSVTLPNSTQIEYLLDGRDRRIGRRVNGTLDRRWVYKDQLNPVAELDASGNIVAEYVYATKPNVPDLMITATATYRLISDHLGSVRLVIDTTTGTVAHRMDYDEFGNVLVDTNPGFQPFGFAGGIYDSATRLVRFGARDYDATTGRWTAKDPIRFGASDKNQYAYASGDPQNRIDSLGFDAQKVGEGFFYLFYYGWKAGGPIPIFVDGLGWIKPTAHSIVIWIGLQPKELSDIESLENNGDGVPDMYQDSDGDGVDDLTEWLLGGKLKCDPCTNVCTVR